MDQLKAAGDPSDGMLSALLDATVDAILVIDATGRIQRFNRGAERMFGYTRDEAVGCNVSLLMSESDARNHNGYISRYQQSRVGHIIGTGREVLAKRRDGSEFPAHLSVGEIGGADRPRYVGILHDISLQVENTRALQAERDRARLYLDVALVMIAVFDASGNIQQINRHGATILGTDVRELVGKNWFEFLCIEDREGMREQVRAAFASVCDDEVRGDIRVDAADGVRRFLHHRCVPLRDASGSVQALLCSAEDETARRAAEREYHQARERMASMSHLATTGEISAGIAHELNQPLSAIATYAQAAIRICQSGQPDPAQVREVLGHISSQALRAGEIVTRLRGLAQRRATKTEATNLSALLADTVEFAKHDLRANDVRIELDVDPDLPEAKVDRIQIQQVLLNLIKNAIDAMQDVVVTERVIRVSATCASDEIRIQITDNGPGVDESVAPRIFEPFVTTKATGSGLGLALSRSIIEAHRGQIAFASGGERGAKFTVSLPA
ncbi:MAG: PAS domain S-box protein [Steroidobacteraceae bacterium]